ncbi:MAG: hypothetical protein ACQERN_06455 [Thermodesulfobacteriota bacterium]
MGLFDKPFADIRNCVNRVGEQERDHVPVTRHVHSAPAAWPAAGNRHLVLGADTAVELGNPKDGSISFVIWTDDPAQLQQGQITVIGPDLTDLAGSRAPFAKIVIAGATDFDAQNSHARHREMEMLRYDIDLKGYMMRGVSQYMREWSRVSREAIAGGFSFAVLGGAIIDKFVALPYVAATEVIFVTAGSTVFEQIRQTADDVFQILSAMNKMVEEVSFDCDSCEYNAVCGDVAELRSMRSSLKAQNVGT